MISRLENVCSIDRTGLLIGTSVCHLLDIGCVVQICKWHEVYIDEEQISVERRAHDETHTQISAPAKCWHCRYRTRLPFWPVPFVFLLKFRCFSCNRASIVATDVTILFITHITTWQFDCVCFVVRKRGPAYTLDATTVSRCENICHPNDSWASCVAVCMFDIETLHSIQCSLRSPLFTYTHT